MTKKTLGYVHLEWTCPNCQRRNPGPQKFCNGCGAPQPQNVQFEQAAEEKLITDQAEIARAKAGPDVHCPYCGARNPGDAKFCGECGGDLTQAAARESGRVVGAHREGPAEQIPCPACGTLNPATAQTCEQCGANLGKKPAEVPEARPPAQRKSLPIAAIIGISLVCLLAAIAVIVLLTRTEEVVGEVRAVSWERSVPILALGPVEKEGWQDEIPSDADLGSCSLEYRYTQDEPAANATEVCGTPYTKDTGSGYGEVVQECEYLVYDDWCDYTVTDWQVFDVVTLTGSDLNPRWPEVNLLSGQKLGEREETYKVSFSTDGDNYTYTTTSENEFSQFISGSSWILEVNTFGSVVSVTPAK
jgi:rRNA maturation endonuclease Nob1